MRDFGVRASNLFLYYRDLDRATAFYRDTLGLELVADYQMARIFRVAEESYLILVDAAKGMHTADEPKSVALALLTDQLEQWHDYLATKSLKPGRPFAARPGSAHDGFVIKAPEGYLLEFERFNQHPENERFVPRRGMNKWTEKKAVNVSFLIDDIDGWFAAVKERALFPLRGTAVSDDDAGRYRAFVGYDPEGYYMEFDLFRAHPANATLMPYLGTPAAK